MAEDEGAVSPEINSSTSQSGEEPSLQLVRVLFLLAVILPLREPRSEPCGGGVMSELVTCCFRCQSWC